MSEPTEPHPVFSVAADSLRTESDLLIAYAHWVLHLCGGNKTKAARLLGIDRRSLYRRLEIKEGSHAAGDRSGNE